VNQTPLNIPVSELRIRNDAVKAMVFDRLRKQYVRLTPEEWVRQQFINYLISHKNYPEGLLANEVTIALGNVSRRCDTVLYDANLRPRMIIEYKAPSISVTQKTFNQILRYNMSLNVSWLIVTNGLQHFCCFLSADGSYSFLKEIPDYQDLK
jgi:predicted type IV restriction endonuclease